MFVFGTCGMSPLLQLHYFYLMPRFCPLGKSKLSLLRKLLVDQLIFTPAIMTHFTTATTAIRGRRVQASQIVSEVKQNLRYQWMVWPFIQTVIFTQLPIMRHVLAINSINVVWMPILLWLRGPTSGYKINNLNS